MITRDCSLASDTFLKFIDPVLKSWLSHRTPRIGQDLDVLLGVARAAINNFYQEDEAIDNQILVSFDFSSVNIWAKTQCVVAEIYIQCEAVTTFANLISWS